jgi:hypothetical protein
MIQKSEITRRRRRRRHAGSHLKKTTDSETVSSSVVIYSPILETRHGTLHKATNHRHRYPWSSFSSALADWPSVSMASNDTTAAATTTTKGW